MFNRTHNTVPDYLKAAVSAVLANDPFHGAFLMHVDLIGFDDTHLPEGEYLKLNGQDVNTMMTDCLSRIWVSRKWAEAMPMPCQATALVHEVQHIVRQHAGPRVERLHEEMKQYNITDEGFTLIRNFAADFVVNKSLYDLGYPVEQVIPNKTCTTVQDFIDWLNGKKITNVGSPLDKKTTSDDSMETIAHYITSQVKVPPNPPPKLGAGGSMAGDIRDDMYQQALAEAGITAEQAESLVGTAIAAAALSAKERGDLPGYVDGLITDFNRPSNNWKRTLRRFVKAQDRDDFSYRRVSRRSTGKIILPALFSEKLGELVVVVDESGSVSDEALSQGLGELVSIGRSVKPSGITIVTCDTRVTGVRRFRSGEPIEIKTGGRGGTDMMPAYQYIAENIRKPAAIILMTDAELNWNFTRLVKAPHITCICNDRIERDFKAPLGTTVRIEVQK
jgi:predicted metal-dependent peptidase